MNHWYVTSFGCMSVVLNLTSLLFDHRVKGNCCLSKEQFYSIHEQNKLTQPLPLKLLFPAPHLVVAI